ncbi:MAG TPA: ABC transporter substrate-binding protein [Candidatus Faecivivens stercorigallinarum]|nr:ABC transporter substrate-binding protein [Candidatus Faecivivens stercorigallinarum]
MKMTKKSLLAMLLAVSMTASLASCGGDTTTTSTSSTDTSTSTSSTEENSATETSTPETEETTTAGSTPRNETLYFAGQQWGTINDWNPMSANSNNAMAIAQSDISRVLIYETLFMYNMIDGSMHGLLATDYEWNEDQTELTVHMNPDAKWNDGTALTAEDVAYTFDTHVKYSSATGVDYANYIDSVEAVDEGTVVFHAKCDDAGVSINPLKVLEYLPKVYVMQKAYLQTVEERNGSDAEAMKLDKMEDLVTSGPYKPYYDDDQKVVFIRDDNYWGQAESMWGKLPVPKYIAHTIYADNNAGQVALAAGEVDVCQQFITDVQKLWEEQELPIMTYMDEAPYGLCTTMPTLWFNLTKPGLDQVEVRKAIAMAIDYDQIIASAMSNQSPTFAQVPRSIMNPTEAEQKLIDKDALADLQFNGKDIAGANALLDEAGIVDTDGDGIRDIDGVNLSYKAECPTGWTDWNASLEIVAAAGKEIGIDISTYFPDTNTFYNDMTTFNFDIVMNGTNGASVSNPWGRAMQLLSSSYNDLEINWSGNWGHYENARADELLALIPHETDEAVLKEYYTELSQIYLTDVPSVSLMYRPQLFYAVNETVWTNYPEEGDDIPPTDCTDGYGVAALYELQLVNP